jgi:regulator of sigma E protease
MDFFIRAAQLILSLSILVVLHEFGHYIPAKLFKTRVEKFYLFFNPWFSLFKKKIGDTEWGIGWLPLGGFVKIAGMVDESMDKEQLAQPAQPWEFRSKPAWQRLIIMLGGVTVNLLLGIFIYGCVVFSYGEEKLAPKDLSNGLAIHPYLEQYGLKSGDNIVAADGEKVEDIMQLAPGIMLRGTRKLDVVHADGKNETITLPKDIDYKIFKSGAFPSTIGPRLTISAVDTVIPKGADHKITPAAEVKMQKGDLIVAVNGEKLNYFDELTTALYHERGKKVALTVLRKNGNQTDSVLLNPKVSAEGTLGFKMGEFNLVDDKALKTVYYGFGMSFVKGFNTGMNTLGDYTGQLKFLFTKKGASSIGGFGSIGKMFPTTWNWQIFWLNTAFISIVLAFMNILPIPALDGGHVVFLLYEIITGKEAPQKVLEYAQIVGFVLLLGLLLYANGNDLYSAIFK